MLRLPIAFNDCSCSLFVCVFWLPGANEYITFVQATRSTTDWRKRCMLIDFFLHIICMHRIWGVNGENLCSCSTWKSTYIILHQRQRLILNRFPALIALAGFVSLMNSMICSIHLYYMSLKPPVHGEWLWEKWKYYRFAHRANGKMDRWQSCQKSDASHCMLGMDFFFFRLAYWTMTAPNPAVVASNLALECQGRATKKKLDWIRVWRMTKRVSIAATTGIFLFSDFSDFYPIIVPLGDAKRTNQDNNVPCRLFGRNWVHVQFDGAYTK